MHFCAKYSQHFIVHGRDVSRHACSYLHGLFSKVERKSIGQIEESVPESNYQGMQQFISDSPWDEQEMLSQVREDAWGLLGGHRDSALYLDETSFVKKGNASVGVQRQYCGRLGKLENCQVGVFACLGRGDRSALVDYRLFLPEEWAKDSGRCQKAKVPEDKRVHRTKPQLALEMVRSIRAEGHGFSWVGGDAAYGDNTELTDALEKDGEIFLMDISSDTLLWDQDPEPVSKSGRIREKRVPSKSEALCKQARVWATEAFAAESQELVLRSTTKGKLEVQVWVKEVWYWKKGEEGQARRRLLVVRQEKDGRMKYSLTNALELKNDWRRLGYMQAQRFWIEHSFGEAKGNLGMAEYEVRGWRGWHHHMALVCLAQLFSLKERVALETEVPLLSVRDIVELLEYYLPRKTRDEREVIANLKKRHRERELAIKSAKRPKKRMRGKSKISRN